MNVVNPSSSFEGTFILFVYQVTNMHIFFWKCMQNLISKCRTNSISHLSLFLSFSVRFSGWPIPSIHSPMPPEAEALLALTAMHGYSRQPTALPPQCQGLTDRHGRGPEGGQKTGQLLQRYHLQQQTHRPVRTGPPQGKTSGVRSSYGLN